MTTTTMPMTAEDEVRALIERWVAAARDGDLERIMATYAPELHAFDAIGPLRFEGAAAYREHWKACLAMIRGPMLFEIHEPRIAVEGDLAFCHYLARCGGAGADGVEQSGWLRATVCARRRGDGWAIVHEHFSVPFDPESGKVSSLEP